MFPTRFFITKKRSSVSKGSKDQTLDSDSVQEDGKDPLIDSRGNVKYGSENPSSVLFPFFGD